MSELTAPFGELTAPFGQVLPMVMGETANGESFPRDVIRDSQDISFERRQHRELRGDEVVLVVPSTGNAASTSVFVPTVVSPNPHNVRIRVVMRELTKDEIEKDAELTVTLQGSIEAATGFSDFHTATVNGNLQGADGLDFEVGIPLAQVSYVRVRVTRSDTVDESGPDITMQTIFLGPQKRKVTALVGHLSATTESTSSAAFDAFVDQEVIVGPSMILTSPTSITRQPFSGDWEIDAVRVGDNQNGTSIVRISLTNTGNWEDSVL